jgi:hypothetical protein
MALWLRKIIMPVRIRCDTSYRYQTAIGLELFLLTSHSGDWSGFVIHQGNLTVSSSLTVSSINIGDIIYGILGIPRPF